jgi:hypothetical protein
MTTRAQREWEAKRANEALEAAEAGTDWHKAYPEATLTAAWWEASRRYGDNAMHQLSAFYLAVRAAREQRDEYLKEVRT